MSRRKILTLILTVSSAVLALGVGGTPAAAGVPTLTISPSATVVGVGGTMGFLAVYYSSGPDSSLPQYLDPSLVTWSVDRPGVLSADAEGRPYGRKRGLAVVTASFQGLTAKGSVLVAGTLSPYALVTPDGRTRTYLLYVPDTYTGDTAVPLVIAYHGLGGDGRDMMHMSQLNTVAYQYNFLVAYPDGVGEGDNQSWNGGGCCATAMEQDVDDVEFTRRLVDDVSARYRVKPRKIFATGMSNGAVMVHRLGAQLADRIAAIAPVAGGAYPGGDFVPAPQTRPMSVIEFHGTTDANAVYSPSIPTTIWWWLKRDGMKTLTAAVSYQRGIVTCSTVKSPTNGTEVSLCVAAPPSPIVLNGVIYDGGGHAWPGGVKGFTPDADVPTYDIAASWMMWDFFARHPMP